MFSIPDAIPVVLPAPEEVVLHFLGGFLRPARAGVIIDVPTLVEVVIDHFRQVRSVAAILAHAPLLVYRLADIMPFQVPGARAARSDLIACRAFMIEADIEPIVFVG